MSARPVADRQQRERALEADRSFIVQAPAGSGKTELLMQRYLRLLATVDHPEEIVALTFTRKAAGEMRNRILEALEAAYGPEPGEDHRRLSWRLAQAALERNAQRGWGLARNPNRFRIHTIDALCATLTRQMPLLARFGGQPAVVEDASELYREAARTTLRLLEEEQVEWSDAVAGLLRHLDNDLPRVEGMVADMLARRDQWLRHVVSYGESEREREALEEALRRLVEESLQELRVLVPPELESELIGLARFAASNLQAAGTENSPLLNCLELPAIPGVTAEDLPQWLGLAELLLTQGDTPRKSVTKESGFLAPSSAKDAAEKELRQRAKDRFFALQAQLAERTPFVERLAGVRRLPPVVYTEGQWAVLQALFPLLKIAVAQLRLVMAAQGRVDFIEVALGATDALGEEDAPTDLALTLDYRIRHLLVDEFQDTSFGQFKLLRRLTAGWEGGDGRTLFVVGDPMQSIYRFREAEVGLFLRARREGIGQIALEPLTLSVNFRSQQGIVEWVNRVFAQVLPGVEEIAKGAVSYTPSEAYREELPGPAVRIHPCLVRDDEAEARQVTRLVQEARERQPQGTIAILVRTRSHLRAIVPRLQDAGLQFRAVDVDPLGERPVVYDLLALTRALLHPADRLSWLAVLRAPWCGLTLSDLLLLAGEDRKATLWERILDDGVGDGLSPDGTSRVTRLRKVLAAGLAERRRRPLSRWIEGLWLALGGPATVRSHTELEEAQLFFQLLRQLDEGSDLADFSRLTEAVERLFAPSDVEADESLQIMTLHKAKGLEFDTVILPGLGRRPRNDDPKLLQWLERPARGGVSDLLLAPVKRADEQEDPIYNHLRALGTERVRLEEGRLLYVAATRARRRLHLLGHAGFDAKTEELKPDGRSLLASLWPALASEFEPTTPVAAGSGRTPPPGIMPLRRLPVRWQLPSIPRVDWQQAERPGEPAGDELTLEFDWVGETARQVGSVVHRYLQRFGEEGVTGWDPARIRGLRPAMERMLAYRGVAEELRESAVERVVAALLAVLADDRGRWFFAEDHREGRSEYALTARKEGKLVNVVIDRTFVDAEGIRWIVDFKTSVHEGGGREQFLDREQERYRAQLEGYAEIFRRKEERPIRLGLYFPLLGGWRSWEA
jgi:ATP-dependent helicase/nuclease subunit A